MSNAAQRATAARRKPRLEPKRLAVSYFDVVLVVVAAPVVLLLGAPATGYAIGSAAWVLLRLLGAAVDRRASTITHWSEQVGLRLSYRSLRLVLLAAATLFALSAGGKQDGVTALVVIAVAFTLQLSASLRDALQAPLTAPDDHGEPAGASPRRAPLGDVRGQQGTRGARSAP